MYQFHLQGRIYDYGLSLRKLQYQVCYLQCVGLVSAQQEKHTADTLVHSMEGNLTAGQLLHSTGTEKGTDSSENDN
jgi:hypothetical protein